MVITPLKPGLSRIDWLFSCAYGPNRITIYVACPTSVAAVGCPAGICKVVSLTASPVSHTFHATGPGVWSARKTDSLGSFSVRSDVSGVSVSWRIFLPESVSRTFSLSSSRLFSFCAAPCSRAVARRRSVAYGCFICLYFLSVISMQQFPAACLVSIKISLHASYMEEWWCL